MGKRRELIKLGVGLIAGAGVSTIIGGAVGMVRPRDVGKIKNFCIVVGGLVLASMASDQATKYTDEKIDEVGDQIDTITKGIKGILEENDEEEGEA